MRAELRTLSVAAGLLACSVAARAQSVGVGTQPTLSVFRPSFHAIHAAMSSGWYELDQERRFLVDEPTNDWIAVSEALLVGPDGAGGSPTFKLTFQGIVGAATNSTQRTIIERTYREQAGFLFLQAGFRIEDPTLAAQNYLLIDLGAGYRAGRHTRRVAVVPKLPTRSSWLLELDGASGYPLFQAEYRVDGRLLSVIEARRFQVGLSSRPDLGSWWKPRLRVAHYASLGEAMQQLPPKSNLPVPNAVDLPPGFRLGAIRTIQDDLSPELTLTLLFTDGVDEVAVQHTLNAPVPPVPLPLAGAAEPSYAVFVYRDVHAAQFMFHAAGTRTLVLGRKSLSGLERLTTSLLEQSVN